MINFQTLGETEERQKTAHMIKNCNSMQGIFHLECISGKKKLLFNKFNKFEMFQTIIGFTNLIPLVFKLAYVQNIKLKSIYNF